jgi:hypothetical protein
MTTLQKTLVAVIVAAAVVAPLALYQRSTARQRALNESLRQSADQIATQQAENERLAALASQADVRNGQSNDLLRLRAEAAGLRRQSNALPRLRRENRRLQAASDLPSVEPLASEKAALEAREALNKKWVVASFMYARANQGHFPASLDNAASVMRNESSASATSAADQLEIVYQGSFDNIANPQDVIVLKQKDPLPYGNRWVKSYAYGDGHVERHIQPGDDFSEWEAQHILAPSNPNP